VLRKVLQIKLNSFFELLRWDKPTGRLILLIPAGWSLYLTPGSNPNIDILLKIIFGGLLVSGLGCVANDIWDKKIDQKVIRTQNRPLAANKLGLKTAYLILEFFNFSFSIASLALISPSRYLAHVSNTLNIFVVTASAG